MLSYDYDLFTNEFIVSNFAHVFHYALNAFYGPTLFKYVGS